MKKIIMFLCIIALVSNTLVYAYEYSNRFKQDFYDNFVASFFNTLQESLMKQNYKDRNVYDYVSTLKGRFDRTQLENETWACVSKYSPEQLKNSNKILDECFDNWSNKFFFEANSDAISILKK